MILIGILLRLINYFSPKSLWSDEFWSIELATKSLKDVLVGSFQDVHPPLYFIFLHLTSSYPRLVSLCAGLVVLVLSERLARRLFGREVGFITAVMVALSGYALHSGQEVRGYALASAFVLGAIYASTFKKQFVLACILGVCAVFTEHYAWFLVPAFLLVRCYWIPWVMILAGFPMLFLGFVQAFISEHVHDLSRVAEYLNAPWMVKKIVGIFFHFSTGYRYAMLEWSSIPWKDPLFQLCAIVTVLMGSLFFYGLVRMNRRARMMPIGLFLLPLIFLAVVYPIRLDSRYLAFAWPIYMITVAYGLSRLEVFFRACLVAPIIFCLFSVSVYQINLPYDPKHKEDWRALEEYVQRTLPDYDGHYHIGVTNMNKSVSDRQRKELEEEFIGLEYDGEERFPKDGLAVVYKFKRKL